MPEGRKAKIDTDALSFPWQIQDFLVHGQEEFDTWIQAAENIMTVLKTFNTNPIPAPFT